MVDFHSHILPGVDDGSRSVEESLELLRMEKEQGITHVVATPHFYPRHNDPETFLDRRNRAARALSRAMEAYPDLPRFSLGAEVHYFRGMSESDLLPKLRVLGTACILVEMPRAPWQESMYEDLARIPGKWGLTPVIAHLDRYIRPFHTHGIPQRLEQLPVLVQANASFFTDRHTASLALKLLDQDRIHLLGSDCHDPQTRPPELGAAMAVIRRKLGEAPLERINLRARKLKKPSIPAVVADF